MEGRREFLQGIAATGALLAAEGVSFGQNTKPEKKREPSEFDVTQSFEKGIAQLGEIGRHARPEINTAFYVHGPEGKWVIDSHDARKENKEEQDLNSPNYVQVLGSLNAVNNKDVSVDLYRIGPVTLPGPNEVKAAEARIQKNVQEKRLLAGDTWMAYLPARNAKTWTHSDIMMNAYATHAYKKAESHIITPYGTISLHVRDGREPWAAYNEMFNESESVLEAMKQYGGDMEFAALEVSLTGASNPVITVRETLGAVWDKVKPASGQQLETDSSEYAMNKFIEFQRKRLRKALNNFFTAFSPDFAEFDGEMDDVFDKAGKGQYKDFDALLAAVEKAYELISVELQFVPNTEMVSKKQ